MSFMDDIYKNIGESDFNQNVKDWLSTGYLPLNHSISGNYNHGLPVGRIIEIFGAESSGKTRLATMAMIETQKRGGIAFFQDFEHAFSLDHAVKLGLNPSSEQWIYKQPDTAEEGFEYIEKVANIIAEKQPDKYVTIVVDSVASMMTQAQLEAGFEQNMRTKLDLPAVMSTSLKKLAKTVNKTNMTLIFLNQTRSNPGVMFGDPEKTTGGNALKFYASVRIKLSKSSKIKEGEEIIGEIVKSTVVKNKVFNPHRKAQYISNFELGIDAERSHIEALGSMGKLGDTKGWYIFDEKKYRLKQLVDYMCEDREAYVRLLKMFVE